MSEYPSDEWGTVKPKKRGRPKGRIRPVRLQVCLSEAELAVIESVRVGETLSELLRNLALSAVTSRQHETKLPSGA